MLVLVLVVGVAHGDVAVSPPATADSPVLVYLPERELVTEYANGAVVCAAFDNQLAGPLWQAPEPVSLGERLVVLGTLVVKLNERLRPWYMVRTMSGAEGTLPSDGVTNQCLRGDLDGDGREDVLTVVFDRAGAVLVQARFGKRTAKWTFRASDHDEVVGGEVRELKLHPAIMAGVPLVEMTTGARACCREFRRFLRIGPDIRQALELASLSRSDEDAVMTAAFDPQRREVTVTERRSKKSPRGTLTPDGPPRVRVLHLDWKGVYR